MTWVRFDRPAARVALAAFVACGASPSVAIAGQTARSMVCGPPAPESREASAETQQQKPRKLALPPRQQLDERFRRSGPAPVDARTYGLHENRRRDLVYRDPEGRFHATVDPDGRVSFRDRGLSFRNQRVMGIYDVVLAVQGTERHQSAKRALLRATFQDRLAMRVEWTLANLDDAQWRLWSDLREIWQDERTPPAERKRVIWQRWDECDVDVELSAVDGAVSRVDRQRRTVARRAQRTIEHFVRLHVDDREPPRVVGGDNVERTRYAQDGRPDYDFHGVLASPASTRSPTSKVDPEHDLAVSIAPDLFEECELDPNKCILVGDLLVGRRANAFDADRGAHYYARACDVGDPWACYELAVLHYLGLGVARDDRRAAELHGVACEAGVAMGCAYLVHLHRRGLGVAKSQAHAGRYRRLACAKGLDDYCDERSPKPAAG
jgi:hypothetical protein